MTPSRFRSLVVASAVIGATVLPTAAVAAFPEKPIKVLVAFRAGGGADTLARLVTRAIEKKHGWKFVVQNKTGGGGAVMAKSLVKEKADGYTIGMSVSPFFGFATVYKKTGVSAGDFAYLGSIAKFQMGLMAMSDRGWKTLDEAMAASKKKGEVIIGAMGDKLQFASRAIAKKYGVKAKIVPTRGGRGVMNQLLGGHVDIGWGAGIQGKYVSAGKMVILASGQDDRLRQAPDKKTLRELGVPLDTAGVFLMVGPKDLPAPILKTLSSAIEDATKDPEVRGLIDKKLGLVTTFNGPDALRKFIADKNAEARALVASN